MSIFYLGLKLDVVLGGSVSPPHINIPKDSFVSSIEESRFPRFWNNPLKVLWEGQIWTKHFIPKVDKDLNGNKTSKFGNTYPLSGMPFQAKFHWLQHFILLNRQPKSASPGEL